MRTLLTIYIYIHYADLLIIKNERRCTNSYFDVSTIYLILFNTCNLITNLGVINEYYDEIKINEWRRGGAPSK